MTLKTLKVTRNVTKKEVDDLDGVVTLFPPPPQVYVGQKGKRDGVQDLHLQLRYAQTHSLPQIRMQKKDLGYVKQKAKVQRF